jgi:tetratricopeptide (TPR) repeat protein
MLAFSILWVAALAAAFEIPAGDPSELAAGDLSELGSPASHPAGIPQGKQAPLPRGNRIQEAWSAPAASLESRTTRTRREATSAGVWSVDPAARAALRDSSGNPLALAQAAVVLAPDLPAAHMALASARWLHGDDPIAAVWSVVDALAAAFRHPEGAPWLLGSALFVIALCLSAASLVTLLGSGLASLAHAGHDLGHKLAPRAPEFARVALVLSLVLVPLALGEGLAGFAIGAMGIAVVYGNSRARVVLASAAALLCVSAFPLAEFAGRALTFFSADTTAAAAYSLAGGSGAPMDVARLAAQQREDDLAVWALAIDARQRGSVGEADAYYQRLLESRANDPSVANNAANVRLDLDHQESAFALYGQALVHSQSAVVLFNLSQAYGRAFQVDDLNRTLGRAQAVDGDLVASLTALEGSKTEGFVADLPLPTSVLWERLFESPHGAVLASELRTRLAPGRLGSDPWIFGGSFAAVWLVFAFVGARSEPAHGCGRCGTRVCARCEPANIDSALCTSCTRLFFQPEKTDRALRTERIHALQRRRQRIDQVVTALSVLVPGAAGLLSKRPLTLLLGAFCFALLVAGVAWRNGVVTDPDVLGSAVPVVFLGMATLGFVGHAVFAASALSARRKEQA